MHGKLFEKHGDLDSACVVALVERNVDDVDNLLLSDLDRLQGLGSGGGGSGGATGRGGEACIGGRARVDNAGSSAFACGGAGAGGSGVDWADGRHIATNGATTHEFERRSVSLEWGWGWGSGAGGMTVAGERAGAGVGEAGSGAGAGVEWAGTREAIAVGGEENFDLVFAR